jgi:hypothetical protein
VQYDGWYGSVRKAPMAEHVAALHALRVERGVDDRPFEISAVHLGVPGVEELERLAKDGVDRLVVTPWQAAENVMTANGTAVSLEPLERYARRVGLA